jgi:hypothetical protein
MLPDWLIEYRIREKDTLKDRKGYTGLKKNNLKLVDYTYGQTVTFGVYL